MAETIETVTTCPSCGERVDVAGGREGTHWYRDHGTYNEHVCKPQPVATPDSESRA